MIHLSLIRGTATVPEEEPLQTLAAFQLILEAKLVVLVGEFEEVEQLGGGFHDGERGRLVVVDQYRDTAYWRQVIHVSHRLAKGEKIHRSD